MQESNFIAKITGRGELDMQKMPGFQPPDDKTHEELSGLVLKKVKKEIRMNLMWIVLCAGIAGFYIFLYIKSIDAGKRNLLTASMIFILAAVLGFYRYWCVDRKVKHVIAAREYKVRTAKIHHVMPGIRKDTVKIQDEKGNVYYYEFFLNRKLQKQFKNDPETEFTIIQLDEKKNIYSIAYLEREEVEKTHA